MPPAKVVSVSPMARRIPKGLRDDVAQFYSSGNTVSEASVAFGVSRWRAYEIIREAGVMRTPSDAAKLVSSKRKPANHRLTERGRANVSRLLKLRWADARWRRRKLRQMANMSRASPSKEETRFADAILRDGRFPAFMRSALVDGVQVDVWFPDSGVACLYDGFAGHGGFYHGRFRWLGDKDGLPPPVIRDSRQTQQLLSSPRVLHVYRVRHELLREFGPQAVLDDLLRYVLITASP